MADMATMRMKTQHFWDKHGISAALRSWRVLPYALLVASVAEQGRAWKVLIRTVKRLWCDEKSTGILMY